LKPKILFILHLPPPIHGSSVVGKNIKESKIINNSFDCSYINLGTSKNIQEIGKNGMSKILNYFSILWKVINQVIYFRPDLVYLSITAKGIAFYKDGLIALIIKLFGGKIVFHFHNKGVNIRQDYFMDNLLYNLILKNSEVILLSKYQYSDVQKYVPLKQIHYCPNGIPNVSDNIIRSKEKGNTQLLFFSNLIESKGVFVLLKACQILKQKGLQFHCNFVGEIGDVSKNKFQLKVTELGLHDVITYWGAKYGNEKKKFFKNTDVFVFPTYNETFGIVILEAMMHGLPVISTFEGAIPEIVKNGTSGFLVHQKKVLELAEKLEVLIKDPSLRLKMGHEGKNIYMKKFTIDVFENRLWTILEEIIHKKVCSKDLL